MPATPEAVGDGVEGGLSPPGAVFTDREEAEAH
jgi:hypothetical protein